MRILVTGTGSGLGRYLTDTLEVIEINRENPISKVAAELSSPVDVIIHCAANGARDVETADLFDYMQDNIFLTEQLSQIPHKVFILISTIAVYPPDDCLHSEETPLWIGDIQYAYPITKLMSEAIIRANCQNHLILRPTAMLGMHSRPNSVIRILTEEICTLTLDSESAFNYILHEDVAEFILICLRNNITGTFNLASSDRMTLKEAMVRYGRDVTFGSHHYQIGTIDNTKAKAILPAFSRTSEETLRIFAKEQLRMVPVT